MEEPLQSAGVRLLNPGVHPVHRGGATLWISGTDYHYFRASRSLGRLHSQLPPSEPSILLAHTPDVFHKAARLGFDLILSGHTHGGQIRLPGIGSLVLPSRYGRRYAQGLFRRGKTLLYVSQGAGGHIPLRIRSKPEIIQMVLRPSRE